MTPILELLAECVGVLTEVTSDGGAISDSVFERAEALTVKLDAEAPLSVAHAAEAVALLRLTMQGATTGKMPDGISEQEWARRVEAWANIEGIELHPESETSAPAPGWVTHDGSGYAHS